MRTDRGGGRAAVADRLRGLEALGLSFSRNRGHDFWAAPGRREVLALRRFLERLAADIARHEARGELELDLSPPGADGRCALTYAVRSLALKREVHLWPAELGCLVGGASGGQPPLFGAEVAQALGRRGLVVP